VPKQKLVHVHAGAEELGRVYQATLPINSNYEEFVSALSRKLNQTGWKDQGNHCTDYLAWNKPIPCRRAALRRSHRLAVAEPARGRDRHQRRGQFRELAAPAFPVQGLAHAARADQRLDGLQRARGGGGEDRRAGRTVVALAGDGEFLMNGRSSPPPCNTARTSWCWW
jgi:acetolactate synthase-1/2/3 large subunit